MREYKEIYIYEQYKKTLTSYKTKTRERSRRAWKDRAPDGLPMIHASVAHL